MDVKTLYILLSENESYVENDVDLMISQKVITKEDLSDPSTLVICISRDYLDTPNKTGAVRIRDHVSRVFTPEWLVSSIRYETLLPIMYLSGDDMPVVTVICKNEEMYNNLDYYLHLSNFENRYRVLLGGADGVGAPSPVPIVSEISRVDVKNLGHMTEQVLEMAGYQHDENGPVPGWVFQCANNWMTRLLDLYDIVPTKRIEQPRRSDLLLTKEDFIQSLENPIISTSHVVGEDIRVCIIDSYETRKKLYEYTKKLLDRI